MPPNRSTVAATAALHFVFFADVAFQRQALPARRSHRIGRGVDGARQLGIGHRRFGGDGDIGAVARGAQGDGQADAARGAGDEEGFACESGHVTE